MMKLQQTWWDAAENRNTKYTCLGNVYFAIIHMFIRTQHLAAHLEKGMSIHTW